MSASLNHGIINRKYYLNNKIKKITIEQYQSPIVNKIEKYFTRYQGRDKYYSAMKHHAVKILFNEGYTLQDIAKKMCMKTHASVFYLLYKYVPLQDHEEFINEHFMSLLMNDQYPISPTQQTEKRQGIKFHIKTIQDGEL